jgi:DNA-binding transcriptional LysR family regulator
MDRFDAMRTYVRVVETGSITAAADSLGLAKSAVSRRLAELETRLGVQLLVRTTRRISVTDPGRAFYERCVAILADLAEAEATIAHEEQALTGRLRVAAPLSFGLAHLGPALVDFAREHPGLTIDIDFSDRYVDLVAEGFDLGVRIGELRDSSLIARRLTVMRHTLCASPEFARARGGLADPGDLDGQPWLRYATQPTGTLPYQAPDGREGTLRLRLAMTASNGDFLRDAAIAGLGVTLLPNFIVYESLAGGELVPLLPTFLWRSSTAYAIYPPTRHLSLRVRRFIDFLADRFGERPYWDGPCPVPAPG